jgi:hypothetical protein
MKQREFDRSLTDYVRDAEKFEDHAGEGLLAG